MEMSHSGLVRLPAKEVGVEAPREFESPHLRQRKGPGVQQRAGASSSGLLAGSAGGLRLDREPAKPLRRPLPADRARESAPVGAFASGRSGCLRVLPGRSGIA